MTEKADNSRWLRRIVRVVAWAVVPVYLVGMGSKIWLDNRNGLPTTLFDVMLAVGFGAFAVVGAVLVAKRPENLVSWIMVAIGLMTALLPAAEAYAAWVMTTRGVPDLLAVVGAWANGLYWFPLISLALVCLPLFFPDGRLPSPRWRWLAIVVTASLAVTILLSAFRQTLIGQDIPYQIANPIGIAGAPSVDDNPLMFGILVAGLCIGLMGAVGAVVVRFRRSRGVERQQMKWFLYAVAFYPLLLLTGLFDRLPPIVVDLVFGGLLLLLPGAVGVAILRYRLYDIDVVIRKTLVYSMLTALLALVYFGVVVVLQAVFSRLTGVEQSTLAVVISTLAIVALFTPLRQRIQEAIDRRFYRKKYNAQQVLAHFAQTARDETDLDALAGELARVTQETMQPENVRIWLAKPGAHR